MSDKELNIEDLKVGTQVHFHDLKKKRKKIASVATLRSLDGGLVMVDSLGSANTNQIMPVLAGLNDLISDSKQGKDYEIQIIQEGEPGFDSEFHNQCIVPIINKLKQADELAKESAQELKKLGLDKQTAQSYIATSLQLILDKVGLTASGFANMESSFKEAHSRIMDSIK